MEYGESRPVIPVGGGLPIAKYYFPPLHQRLRYQEVVEILAEKGWDKDVSLFYENVCDCPTCKEVIGEKIENFREFGKTKPVTFTRRNQIVTMNYPYAETKDLCLRHYLYCKQKEFKMVKSLSEEDLVSELINSEMQYEDILGLDAVSYLSAWKEAITS